MILFTEYIKCSGRRNASARHLLAVGRFTTTQKLNGRWYIDENEPYPNARDFVHFTLTSRRMLETFKRKGYTNAECARRLGCHRSAITHELRRGTYTHTNSDLTTELRYSSDKAQSAHIYACSAMGAPLKLGNDRELAAHIERKLITERRSPAAILGEIDRDKLPFKTHICVATLYSYIRKGVFLNVTLAHLPERGRRKRTYRRVTAPKRPPCGTSIEKRPPDVQSRTTAGHWEMDTVKGKQGTEETLLVLTERKTRYERIIALQDGTTAAVVDALDTLERKLGELFKPVFRTVTVDNGSEFADCSGIERSIFGGQRTQLFYCHPYSSFERGSNENQNRQIRRFIPKGTPLKTVSKIQLFDVEKWLNTNPRKLFNWLTSEQLFAAEFVDAL